jgi:hypothetical protein
MLKRTHSTNCMFFVRRLRFRLKIFAPLRQKRKGLGK